MLNAVFKKITAALTVTAVMFCSMSAMLTAAASNIGDFEMHVENDLLALYISKTDFMIKDKKTNFEWYSTPTSKEQDEIAQGIDRTDISSLLGISVYNSANRFFEYANSYSSSVLMDGFRLRKMKNGVEFEYFFPDYNLTVPLQIILNQNSVSVKISVKKIIENQNFKLAEVTVLPMFGAAELDEKGFMLVPDGSGAVIEFNNNKAKASEYKQMIYGRDLSDELKSQSENTQTAHLPVFAFSKEAGSMLCVITKADAHSTLTAYGSQKKNSYNSVYNTFELRHTGQYTINQGKPDEQQFDVFQEDTPALTDYEAQYFFTGSGLSNITDTYREYLTESYKLKPRKTDNSLKLEWIGAVSKERSFLGFPINKIYPLTKVSDIESANDFLSKTAGINADVYYNNVTPQNIAQKPFSNTGIPSKLGSLKDFNKISNTVLAVNITDFQREAFPFQKYFLSIRNVNGNISLQNIFKLNTLANMASRDAGYIISLANQKKSVKAINKLKAEEIALYQFGNRNYSDFGANTAERQQKTEQEKQILQSINKDVTLWAANQYTFGSVKTVLDTPVCSSGFDIFDYDVPFYQMALSGFAEMSTTPLNNSFNPDDIFLKAAESRISLKFTLAAQNTDELIDTPFQDLTGADFILWKNDIVKYGKKISEVFGQIGDSRITDYKRIEENVFCSVFENGNTMILNYNSFPVTSDGKTVESKSYLFTEGGENG